MHKRLTKRNAFFPPAIFFLFYSSPSSLSSTDTAACSFTSTPHNFFSKKSSINDIFIIFCSSFFGCFTYIYAYITSSLFLSTSSSSSSSYTQKKDMEVLKMRHVYHSTAVLSERWERNPLLRLCALLMTATVKFPTAVEIFMQRSSTFNAIKFQL